MLASLADSSRKMPSLLTDLQLGLEIAQQINNPDKAIALLAVQMLPSIV